jgi:hypothetical protein
MRRIVTALFDDPAAAGRARDALRALGVPEDRIGLHAEAGGPVQPATPAAIGSEPGIPALLDTLFLPEADFAAHREALRRGGTVVSAEVEDADAAHIAQALDGAGAQDLDAREQDWRREGWSPATMAGAVANDAAGPAAMMPGTGGMDAEAARMLGSGTYATNTAGAGVPDTRAGGAQDPRRLARRDPAIGRARSYVIEAPLAEQADPALSDQAANAGLGGADRGAA